MAIILIIDTATDIAFVGFADSEGIIAQQTNESQKDHAVFLQVAISKLMLENNILLQTIDAVAIVNGPGSYTGLRVGLASAKGFCYALNKPLILINTLEVMAVATIELFPGDNMLHCPLIDARRMEVFTAIYNNKLNVVLPPQPLILSGDSFHSFLQEQQIVFSGNGQAKFRSLTLNFNALFSQANRTLKQINKLAQFAYAAKQFANIAYSEPFYLKNFYIFSR